MEAIVSRRAAAEALTSKLKELGFRRGGTRWYRAVGDVTDVVSLVTIKGGNLVSIELGVFDPQAFERVWPTPKTITEAACIVRQDLALLVGLADLWDPNDPNDVDTMAQLLSDAGIPWLDSMHDPLRRVTWLRSRPLITSEIALLAMAEALQGDLTQAQHRLLTVREGAEGPWVHKIDSLLAGLEELASLPR